MSFELLLWALIRSSSSASRGAGPVVLTPHEKLLTMRPIGSFRLPSRRGCADRGDLIHVSHAAIPRRTDLVGRKDQPCFPILHRFPNDPRSRILGCRLVKDG